MVRLRIILTWGWGWGWGAGLDLRVRGGVEGLGWWGCEVDRRNEARIYVWAPGWGWAWGGGVYMYCMCVLYVCAPGCVCIMHDCVCMSLDADCTLQPLYCDALLHRYVLNHDHYVNNGVSWMYSTVQVALHVWFCHCEISTLNTCTVRLYHMMYVPVCTWVWSRWFFWSKYYTCWWKYYTWVVGYFWSPCGANPVVMTYRISNWAQYVYRYEYWIE